MNKESLKQLLLDQRQSMLKDIASGDIIPRNGLDQCRALLNVPNILLISGMRRAGKSIFASLLAKDRKFAFASFDDERLLQFKAEHFQLLLEAFLETAGDPEYFLFDEIQNIDGWELFINRIRPHHRIIVTGSNATLMSSEMATYLTGRFDVWTIFPMSFDEFLRYKKLTVPVSPVLSTGDKSVMKTAFNEYMFSGGIFENHLFGKERLRTLFRSITTRDIISRFEIANPAALEEMAFFLLNSTANKISLSKIAARTGLKSPHTAKEYLRYIESSFLLFTIAKFSYRIKEQQASFKKIYCCDNGMLSSMLFDFSPDNGRFLENMVAIELKRRNTSGGGEVFYWDDYRRECDFVVKSGNRVTSALQVCHELTDDNKAREMAGILAAIEEFDLTTGTIITADQDDEIVSGTRRITVIPAWKWLLS